MKGFQDMIVMQLDKVEKLSIKSKQKNATCVNDIPVNYNKLLFHQLTLLLVYIDTYFFLRLIEGDTRYTTTQNKSIQNSQFLSFFCKIKKKKILSYNSNMKSDIAN